MANAHEDDGGDDEALLVNVLRDEWSGHGGEEVAARVDEVEEGGVDLADSKLLLKVSGEDGFEVADGDAIKDENSHSEEVAGLLEKSEG